jgi:hypothetical protein
VGDIVCSAIHQITGVVIGYNEKGEGGKDFVHVLVDGEIVVCMFFDLHVVNRVKSSIL